MKRERMPRQARLVGSITTTTVRAEYTACRRAESCEQCNERAESHPYCVTIVGADAIGAELVTSDAEENHVDDPGDEGCEHGKCGSESHDNSSRTVVGSTADAEEGCKTGKTGGDGVEDESLGEVEKDTFVQAVVAEEVHELYVSTNRLTRHTLEASC